MVKKMKVKTKKGKNKLFHSKELSKKVKKQFLMDVFAK